MSYGFTTCSECGVIVPLARSGEHECEHDKWVAYQVARSRSEIERIDAEVARYLETARGRFEVWYAERSRAQAA